MNRNTTLAMVAAVVAIAAVWFFVIQDDETASTASGPPTLLITSPNSGSEFSQPSAVVAGTGTPAATIQVGHQGTVPVSDAGTWQTTVALDPGKNELNFRAMKAGQFSEPEVLTLRRKLTPAEKDAIAEAKKSRRAESAELRQYIRTTREIPYAKLSANADKLEDTKVALRGQVFQIQQQGDGQNYLLMSVTDNGFEWVDTVWVNYPSSLELDLRQIINVYGTVIGERQYESKESGAKFVPQIDAKYITVDE